MIVVPLIVPATATGSLLVAFWNVVTKLVDVTFATNGEPLFCICSVSYIFTSVPAVITVHDTLQAVAYAFQSAFFLCVTTKSVLERTATSGQLSVFMAVVMAYSLQTVIVPLENVTIRPYAILSADFT